MAVIDGIEPVPQSLVELLDIQQNLGIERGQKLLAHGTKEALDLAAAFGLIGRRVHDEDADGGGNAGQLWGAVDLGVVHVEAGGGGAGRGRPAGGSPKNAPPPRGVKTDSSDESTPPSPPRSRRCPLSS